jgi:hypothetical protein
MAKRRDIEGKKVKHKSEGYEYSDELSRRRSRNRIVVAAVVAIVLVIVLVAVFLFMEPEEDEKEEVEILTADTAENEGYPTNAIEFSATINNPDKDDDIYSTLLFALPPDWDPNIPETIIVEGKESTTFNFNVTPSVESSLEGTYTFVLTVTSGNTQQSYSLEYDITILHAKYGVNLTAYNNSHDAEAGRSVFYSLLIENAGNGEENITLSYTESHLPSNWNLSFEYDTVSVPGYDYSVVICTIETFNGSSKGRYDIKVRATDSQGSTSEIWLNTSLTKDFDNETVEVGDKVQVNYIGMFPDGDIFDTSIFEVFNNSKLPKEPGLSQRPSYDPLKFYVGSEEQGQGAEYGNVISGFWKGALGLKVNETKVVRFPSEEGYGDGNWRLFEITLISID